MTYETVSAFSQSWGLVLLVILFLGACGYALWPGNSERFKRAAQLPFEED